MTRVELWMEGETAHLRVHTASSSSFAEVSGDLIAMRDRLTDEINSGPESCPYAEKERATIPASEVGVTLKVSTEARLEIEDIALISYAARVGSRFVFDSGDDP